MVKSWLITVTVRLIVWVRDPPVPVTVTLYEPIGVELAADMDRDVVAEPPEVRPIVLGLRDAVRPEAVDAESETVPEKLLRLVKTRVELADDPGDIERLEGLAEREKSDTEGPMTDTTVVSELMSFPL